MIKGKKITNVSIKVISTHKDNINNVLTILGKDCKPERIESVQLIPQEQKQNEEHNENKIKDDQFKEKKCKSNTSLKISQVIKQKQIPKDGQKDEKKSNNVTSKHKQTKNKSTKQLNCKKENDFENSRRNKDLKETGKKVGLASELTEKVQKSKKASIQPVQKDIKRLSTKDRIGKDILEIKKDDSLEQQYQNCESQRYIQPTPITETLFEKSILDQVEISFQNNDFELKMPDIPIQYEDSLVDSSSEEEEDSTIYQPTTRQLMYQKQQLFPNQLKSQLFSELFSLSADQLLAKKHFNI